MAHFSIGDKLKCTADGCNFETFYKWALEQHRRSKHEVGHRYQCAECPYATSDSGSMCKHKKYHQGVKDYRCSKYTCTYTAVSALNVRTLCQTLVLCVNHQGVKDYRCGEYMYM